MFITIANNILLRAILSLFTGLLITLFFSPVFIRKLQQKQIGQAVRDNGPQRHLQKSGTPTMGGILILIAISIGTILWGDLTNSYLWMVLVATLATGLIGGIDDYRKVILKNSRGLPARWKFFWQSVMAIFIAFWLYWHGSLNTDLLIPFINKNLHLGFVYLFLIYFVIVGGSNAVNLTDGLDGLALFPILLVGAVLGLFAYDIYSPHHFFHMIALPPGVAEITVFAAALVGACLGFLWYNTYPAQVFMGDVGSLGLGAALGTMAILVHQELLFFIMGGIFVAETVSVILQVASFKLTGKRIFKMAPLHHHFELLGWQEPKVIVRFWIITLILIIIGLISVSVL